MWTADPDQHLESTGGAITSGVGEHAVDWMGLFPLAFLLVVAAVVVGIQWFISRYG